MQNAVQEQLCQRDKERERNITKRVQEFEKTFDFVNSHLLKGVATMAELTKADNRQPIGKIKPTDKMVMMPSLFDCTKPATSKQHYERFNLYINFQTKSGHLTDPVGEAIDLFEHMLDKTVLVWFHTNRSKFKDLTTLKTMLLQRYNPWGKTKREQLQSWNILSFNPKTTDVDEHIDLINTLGDMVDQKEEAKKEKFIETMPTMIQTHLIMCKDWATVKDKAKSLKHIIMKCDPPTPAMPTMATGATVLGLYSHIAHSVDKEEGEIPQPFKGAKPKQTRGYEVTIQGTLPPIPEVTEPEDDNSLTPGTTTQQPTSQETDWPDAIPMQIPETNWPDAIPEQIPRVTSSTAQPEEQGHNRCQAQYSAENFEIPKLEESSEEEQFADLDCYLAHHNTYQASEHI